MVDLYWKSEQHKEDYEKLMDKLDANPRDRYRKSFSYLVSATGKAEYLLKHVDMIGVASKFIKEEIEPYSPSERNMILFALQLFNNDMSDIILPDVVLSLDSENYKCVIQAIHIRYGEAI